MKTIKLTENGVEVEYKLTPIVKDLEIPTGISQCGICNEVFRSSEIHECKLKFKVWKPKQGKSCYWIASDSIEYCGYNKGDFKFLHFETHEQAKEFVEKMKFNYEVEMFIKEKNEGWWPDWDDRVDDGEMQEKYYLRMWCNKLEIINGDASKDTSNNKYFKTHKIGEEILAKFDNDKLLKYWI